jgi:diguanylate cyclase (GGDEF)-like protein
MAWWQIKQTRCLLRTCRRSRVRCLVMLLVLALLGLSHACTLVAQTFEAEILGQAQGLANLTVTSLAQGPDGFLWVATRNGLFRYDGSQFREYGRAEGFDEPVAYGLHVDHTGTLWAGTNNGLYWFNGTRFIQVRYQGTRLQIGQNSMLASTTDGELLAATRSGIYSLTRNHSGEWDALPYGLRHPDRPEVKDANGITVDQANVLIEGCGKGLCIRAGTTLRVLGVPQGVPPDYYVALLTTRDGRVWARGRTHIVVWKPNAARAEDVTATFPKGGDKTIFRRMTEDKQGNILTPTAKGFATWDGTHWTETVNTSSGAIDGATNVLAGREGSIWIGTEGAGLLHSLGYQQWANLAAAQGLSGLHTFSIAEDTQGTVWVGNNVGLNRISAGQYAATSSPLAHEADTLDVVSLVSDGSGGIWAATILGRIYHINRTGLVDRHKTIDGYIARLLLAPGNVLWIASGSGVFRANCGDHEKCIPEPVPGPDGKPMLAAEITSAKNGGFWVAADQGLIHIDAQGQHSRLISCVPGTDLKSLRLVAAARDGTLWIGGATPGVRHVAVENGRVVPLASYVQPAIASDEVSFLGIDASDRVWIGTDAGVNVLDHGVMTLITRDDGLIWNDMEDKAFFKSRDGSLWMGTSEGLAHLLDPAKLLHREPFRLIVESLSYGKDRTVLPLHSVEVPWNASPLLVRFAGLTFRDNNALIYRYKLDGSSKALVTTGSGFALFTALPPGHYVFSVTAEDPHHHVFSNTVSLEFALTPPWWKTWEFYLLLVILGLFLFAAVWHWSHLALLSQRHKLRELVSERTRELEVLALHDSLTGLLNRRAILQALDVEIEQARKQKSAFCVALIDLDHFKSINDTHGHLAGDEILREAASRLSSSIRKTDLVGRYGGEEFFVIFRETEAKVGHEQCERVRQALCVDAIPYEQLRLTITCSIGLVCTPKGGQTITAIIAKADEAMYTAKSKGRNRVVTAEPWDAASSVVRPG